MQKPIFVLYLAIVVSVGTVLFASHKAHYDLSLLKKQCLDPENHLANECVGLQGLTIHLLPPFGRASINAKGFHPSSLENYSKSAQLTYSFSANVNDSIRQYSCDSIGERHIALWVTDELGNQTKTTTFINVQDNGDICGMDNWVALKGQVFTEENVRISDVKVSIDGGETESQQMTNADGQYLFTDLAKYNNYELLPNKDTKHNEGITTLDLVQIQRHILGIKTLESPYKLIAADINNSQNITASDLTELRKLILGIQSKFSNNTSWRFVDVSQKFSDQTYPWPFVEKLNYYEVAKSKENSNFVAVKIGDVNGTISKSIQGLPAIKSKDKLNVHLEDADVMANELITIPIMVENLHNYLAFQWTLELSNDMEYIGFESVDLPLRNDHIALIEKNGKKYLTLSYDNLNGVTLPRGSVLFNIISRPFKHTKVSELVNMNDAIITSEAYFGDDITSDIELYFKSSITEFASAIMQNHPNPFKDETMIQFSLQEKSPVSISIFDTNGNMIFTSHDEFNAGNHTCRLTEKEFASRFGVFYCKIKTKNLDKIIKILRIE